MKKLILILCCVLLFGSSQSFAGDNIRDARLVGTWTGVDTKKVSGGFIFNKNGTVILINEDQHMDLSKEGGSSIWRTDVSKNPRHLDILLNFSDGKSDQLLMIYKLLKDDQLLVRQPEADSIPGAV